MKPISEIIWPPVRFRMERTPEALVLRRAPDRSWWNVVVLPVLIVALVFGDYNLDGQGRMAQAVGRYVVPALLAVLNVFLLFRHESVSVDHSALTIEAVIFGWRRQKRIPLREIERLDYNADSTSSDSTTPHLELKRAGRRLLVDFADGISERQATEFLMAIRFVMRPED